MKFVVAALLSLVNIEEVQALRYRPDPA